MDVLLDLPAHERARLVQALRAGIVAPPYSTMALRSALGISETVALRDALSSLGERGVGAEAVAFGLELAGRAAGRIDRPDLVWSGPEVPGVHVRGTRRAYEELIASATHTIWISTYVYFDGRRAFKSLAQRMDAVQDLEVTLLLNIQRKAGDTTSSDVLVSKFAQRLWKHEWPGERRPGVYYDPRALEPVRAEGVLHAKAVVVDERAAFVTSANLTEAAFDHNVEVGMLSHDRVLATSLAQHFRVLIDQEHLVVLP